MPEASKRFYIAGSFVVLLAIAGLAALSFVNHAPASPAPHMGWAGPSVVADAAPLVATMPEFELIYPEIDGRTIRQDNSRRRVVLWDHVKKVNGGQHLTNVRQQIGDCVSWGWRNGVSYLLAVAVATGQAAEFEDVYPPYIYGTSRVQVGGGRLGNSDGSIGAWAAKAVQDYGVLSAEADGVPDYSGSVAKQWGRNGAPRNFVDVAKQFRVRTVAPIRSAEDAMDAICNGYPIPICSNFGTKSFDQREGKLVARGNSSWNHCMCVVGVDSTGSEPYFYVLNSWGPTAHPRPLGDEPPGGFWVMWSQMEYILRQNDSFAVSNFAGFKARDIDFHLIREVNGELGNRGNRISVESGMPHSGSNDVGSSIVSAGHGRGANQLQFDRRHADRYDQSGFAALIRARGDDGSWINPRGTIEGSAPTTGALLHFAVLPAVPAVGTNDKTSVDLRWVADQLNAKCACPSSRCDCRPGNCRCPGCDCNPDVCAAGGGTDRSDSPGTAQRGPTGEVLPAEPVDPMGWVAPDSLGLQSSLIGPSQRQLEELADRAVDRVLAAAIRSVRANSQSIVTYGVAAVAGGTVFASLVAIIVRAVLISFLRWLLRLGGRE